ncbi:MAG TPA: MarR family winged helix-turn-helix transcriptional regulator [Candidatus Saccharimonadales bacterium]|nr:MarR family winged helix-turn-helix transcriptional regulator [Candidatus Saccharimonadales bacterium]
MEKSPVYILHKLVFALDRAADELLQEKFGISHNRAVVLVAILDHQDMTQHQIALKLGRTDAAVSSLMAELIKDGYVAVRVSEHHKRKNVVTLTPAGEALAWEAAGFLNDKFSVLASAAGVDAADYTKQTERLFSVLMKKGS